ncbi:MAG: hypothetical protein AAB316_11835 [Bacteroidota bacterium]
MNDRLLLHQLRQILLVEDREELQRLRAVLDDPALLSQKVTPIIEQRLQFLKNNFPVEFRLAVEQIVEHKLEASREELLEIIYPTLGQMIKKYIQHQFQLLKESIEEQIRSTFERGIIGRLRFAIFGVKPKEMSQAILARMDGTVIEEIFVIEHHSGILLGSASRVETIDLDMIAGMLTAIKAFVEDAFRRQQEHLEVIQYETFTVVLENFPTFYIAAALSGSVSAKERSMLSDSLVKFVQAELRINLKKRDGSSNLEIRRKLERHFFQQQQSQLTENGKIPTP